MKEHNLIIPAGEFRDIHGKGTFLRVKSSGDSLRIELVELGVVLNMSAGQKLKIEGGFVNVKVTNETGAAVAAVILIGEGDFEDASIVGTVSANIVQSATVSDAAPVSVGLTATLLAAADSARKGLRLFNAGTVDIYLGSSGVTVANGAVKILAGELWIETEAAAAAWYGISGTSAQSVRVQEV